MSSGPFVRWSFDHYMNIADPSIVEAPGPRREPVAA
jgi:hypothetical protein